MTVKKLYVVGSGAMGSGIAQTAATDVYKRQPMLRPGKLWNEI